MPYLDKLALRTYQASWWASRRAAYLAGKSCAKCGSDDRLEVDHINPASKTTHRMWSRSQAFTGAELGKCQVLCHTCHKAKSAAEASERQTGKPRHDLRKQTDRAIQRALADAGTVRGAAKLLGIHRSTVQYRKQLIEGATA